MRDYIAACLHVLTSVHVYEAADGLEALHLARGVRPALIIAERALPRLSGLAFHRALRADPRTRQVPVLVIADEALPSAFAFGEGVLAKPFNATGLRVEVERLLGQPLAPLK